jgi:hypothetical protein
VLFASCSGASQRYCCDSRLSLPVVGGTALLGGRS